MLLPRFDTSLGNSLFLLNGFLSTVRSAESRGQLKLDRAPRPGHFSCRVRSVKLSTAEFCDILKYALLAFFFFAEPSLSVASWRGVKQKGLQLSRLLKFAF